MGAVNTTELFPPHGHHPRQDRVFLYKVEEIIRPVLTSASRRRRSVLVSGLSLHVPRGSDVPGQLLRGPGAQWAGGGVHGHAGR